MTTIQCLALCVAVLSELGSSQYDRILRATSEDQYIKIPTSGMSDNSSSENTTQISRKTTSSTNLETWIIEANRGGYTVKLQININIDICDTCTCDWLYIYDGSNSDAERIGKFCGNYNGIVTSSGLYLYVVLLSYVNNKHTGSYLKYIVYKSVFQDNSSVADFTIQNVIIIISGVVFASIAISCAIWCYRKGMPKNQHQPQISGPSTPQHCPASASDHVDPPSYREVFPDATPHVSSQSGQFELPSLNVMNCHNPVYDSDRQSSAPEQYLPPASDRNDYTTLHEETCQYPAVQRPLRCVSEQFRFPSIPADPFRNFASLHTLSSNNGESEMLPTYEDFCQNPEAFKMK